MLDEELRQARARAATRTALVGAGANALMAVGKVTVGYAASSQALVVDGIHSVSDLLSDLLVWFAGKHASQAPDAEHPYGHGRYETLATLLLGGFLMVVAIGLGWDSAQRLFNPEELLTPAPLALYAAAASILVNEALFWYTLGYARRVRSDMLRANAWHHRSDAISSIVVLIGVGGTMAGLPYLDAVAAVLVAVMIAKIAADLGWEAMRELVDTGLEAERLAAIRKTIDSVGGVRDIHMLRTRKHGGKAAADVHVLVDPRVSVSEGHIISALVEQRLKGEIDEIIDVTVHIDPEDDEAASPTTGLPLRTEAIARLDRLWKDVGEGRERFRTVLHYLNGRIDVEVFFPLEVCAGQPEEARRLNQLLQTALEADPAFGRVNAYFG
jgi:cation diffusion facilitator family transporter